MPRVLNKHKHGIPKGSKYIGRGTKWGNPFRIGVDGTREEVILKYKEWIQTQDNLLESLDEIRGYDLVCFCSPQACHGDLLIELANTEDN